MNDKFRSALDAQLSGFEWGKHEQAEVLRLIRRKEPQDMKHIKRSSGILAAAMALLIIIMGAAFAIETRPLPQETPLTQPTQTEFVPTPLATLEGKHLTLFIHSAAYDGANAAFCATLQLREPGAFRLAITTPDGRTHTADAPESLPPLNVLMDCSRWYMVTEEGDQLLGSFDSSELLDASADSLTLRITGCFDVARFVTLPITLWLTTETEGSIPDIEELYFQIPNDSIPAKELPGTDAEDFTPVQIGQILQDDMSLPSTTGQRFALSAHDVHYDGDRAEFTITARMAYSGIWRVMVPDMITLAHTDWQLTPGVPVSGPVTTQPPTDSASPLLDLPFEMMAFAWRPDGTTVPFAVTDVKHLAADCVQMTFTLDWPADENGLMQAVLVHSAYAEDGLPLCSGYIPFSLQAEP